ncbi:predicted protein [Streptomyces sp. SPB78]|nr:predicted protein [Streptomyces sp. SPB78]
MTSLPDPPAPGEGHGTPREGTPDPADTGAPGGGAGGAGAADGSGDAGTPGPTTGPTLVSFAAV